MPVNISERLKSQIREIQLFWKDPSTGSWSLLQKCPPTQPGFKFQADKEGAYWFTMTTVNLDGKSSPADPEQSQFRMAVIVDLQSPSADVQFVQVANEGQIIQIDVRDPNLDPNKTHVSYQTKDQVWRSLDPIGQTNHFCIPIQAATTGLIRVNATDLAGNTMQHDYDLSLSKVGQVVPESGNGSAAVGVAHGTKPGNLTASTPSEPFQRPYSTERIPTKSAEGDPNVVRVAGSNPGDKSNDIVIHAADIAPPAVSQQGGVPLSLAPSQRPTGPCSPGTSGKQDLPTRAPTEPSNPKNTCPPQELQLPSAPEKTSVSVDRQLINHLQVLLAYKVEQVGASGVGKVEVWITRDQCKTWQKLCEDPQRKSPLAIELPAEGLYGITLVVSNGRGFGNAPPKSGEAPEAWIEVDLTKPTAEMTSVRPGAGEDAGAAIHNLGGQGSQPGHRLGRTVLFQQPRRQLAIARQGAQERRQRIAGCRPATSALKHS